jgi:hypothetical protein
MPLHHTSPLARSAQVDVPDARTLTASLTPRSVVALSSSFEPPKHPSSPERRRAHQLE